MFVQITIYSPRSLKESSLPALLQQNMTRLQKYAGFHAGYIVQDPSWGTLLALYVWKSKDAYQQAQQGKASLTFQGDYDHVQQPSSFHLSL